MCKHGELSEALPSRVVPTLYEVIAPAGKARRDSARAGMPSLMIRELKCMLERMHEGCVEVQINKVKLCCDSLNLHHVFVLDAVSTIYIYGEHGVLSELKVALEFAEHLASDRLEFRGLSVRVTDEIDDGFWQMLKVPHHKGSTMEMISEPQCFKPILYLVSKEGHESYFKGFLKEVPMTRSSLTQEDVFVLDSGRKVYIWEGQNAGESQKINAGLYANSVEAKRGGDPAVLAHDADDTFWRLLDGNFSVCQTEISNGLKLPSFHEVEPELKKLMLLAVPSFGKTVASP